MSLPITAITAAVCAALLLLLAIDTVRNRLRARALFGDGGDVKLLAASRAHANLAEHAPLAIIMIGILELSHAHHWALTVVATLFLIARVFQAIGLYAPPANGKPPVARQIGVIGTWLCYIILIGWTLFLVGTRNF